jgi:hypothetical protein
VELPVVTERVDGVAEREKSGAAVTISVTFAVWVKLPLTPVTVRA